MSAAPRTLQELPPRWAHFCLGLERFAAWRTRRDFRDLALVVGVSGGVDSTALLQALVCLADRCGLRLVAAHLDHYRTAHGALGLAGQVAFATFPLLQRRRGH